MTDQAPQREKTTTLDIARTISEGSVVHQNVSQEFILVTEDKVKLCLLEHQNALKSQGGWIAPVSLLIPLITTLVAADFKTSALGFSAEVWKTLYLIGIAVSAGWLVREAVRAISARKATAIERIIQRLKQGSSM